MKRTMLNEEDFKIYCEYDNDNHEVFTLYLDEEEMYCIKLVLPLNINKSRLNYGYVANNITVWDMEHNTTIEFPNGYTKEIQCAINFLVKNIR